MVLSYHCILIKLEKVMFLPHPKEEDALGIITLEIRMICQCSLPRTETVSPRPFKTLSHQFLFCS